MPDVPEDRIMTDKQARDLEFIFTAAKAIIVAVFAVACWQTYVQITLNQHTTQIEHARAEAQEWARWREDLVRISTRQTTLLEVQQSQITQLQLGRGPGGR